VFRVFVSWGLCLLPLGAQSLDSLVDEALRSNPEIIAAQKRYEAARQRPSRESTLPDPTLSLGYASNGKPWPGAGLGIDPTSNIGVMITQELPAPGKLKLRGEIASKEAEAAYAEYRSARLRVIARLKVAYHQLHHAYAATEIMRTNQKLLGNFIKVAEARYSVGRAAQQDVFRAQAQYAIMETQIVRMEQDKPIQQSIINSILNRPRETAVTVTAEMKAGELRVTLEKLLAGARDDAPMILRDQKMVERSQLALNLARRGYYPDYAVSGGYFNQGGMPPMYQVRVDLKIPAWFWRKQRAEVTEQAFQVSEARHTYEADRQSLAVRIEEEYVNAQTARRLMDLYSNTVIPQSSLALESGRASYETGALDFMSMLMNFMTMVDYQLNYHEEMVRFHVALARLEEMTGVKVD
jgi:cobalt-zinc-cadmium efflux system outer membrane protein